MSATTGIVMTTGLFRSLTLFQVHLRPIFSRDKNPQLDRLGTRSCSLRYQDRPCAIPTTQPRPFHGEGVQQKHMC